MFFSLGSLPGFLPAQLLGRLPDRLVAQESWGALRAEFLDRSGSSHSPVTFCRETQATPGLFPHFQVHIQVSVHLRDLKWEVLFSGYPLFILACFLDVFLARWTSGWGKALSWPFPKAACGWEVSQCIDVLRPYSTQKSKMLVGQVSRERRTSLQFCK